MNEKLANASPSEVRGEGGGGCDEILDAFDERFDRMRRARQLETAKLNLTDMAMKKWFDPFEPEATCFTEERFGSTNRMERYAALYDGPKFICGVDHIAEKARRGRKKADCLVYSIGSNDDVSFERAVHDHIGCEIHTFDPTLRGPFVGQKYATFHPWGLGEDGAKGRHQGRNWTSKSLETIVRKLGHANRTIDILKVDCEECEYASLPKFLDIVASGEMRVGQLQVELHMRKIKHPRKIHNFFAAADRAGLRIFHKERNHWGCQGFWCVEYALVSERFLREANRAAVCPSG